MIRVAVLLALLLGLGCRSPHVNSFGFDDQELATDRLPSRVAFGSCAHQDRPQPILHEVIEHEPDLFIYLGDNIYGDTEDMEVLRAKYGVLAAKPEFQALRAQCPTLAVWDDHDYGANDAGRHYPRKEESREIFLDFWAVPEHSSQRGHAGNYGDHVFRQGGRSLQVILLDTRSFRDDLMHNLSPAEPPYKNDYRPHSIGDPTLLGDEQWRWLEERLREPADLRIIASSIQFGHSYNGWESWTNLPQERRRMIDLISRTRAAGVVFISGDVHWGEISRQEVEGGYPLYDVTASGLNRDWDKIEANARRVGPAVPEFNFGLIEIDWHAADPEVSLMSIDVEGRERNRVRLKLSDLGW
jgi:alkaline phosphatase D